MYSTRKSRDPINRTRMTLLWLLSSVSISSTASTSTVVDDPPGADLALYTDLAIGLDGAPIISHFQQGQNLLRVVKCTDAACVGPVTVTLVDDSAPTVPHLGSHTSIVVTSDGLPLISYLDATNWSLRVAKCLSPTCNTGTTITVVDDPAAPNRVGEYSSMAIGSDGFPVIAYHDGFAGTVKVAKCQNLSCTASVRNTPVDPATFAGDQLAIAIGTDGFPVISYHANGSLEVVKCNDAACAGNNETISVVDAGDPADNDIGYDTSIAIGADGLPVISYQSIGNGSQGLLKVAKCNDPACAGSNETVTTVDGMTGPVANGTSIAIGLDGLPIISYDDLVAGGLKVAWCLNASCTQTLLSIIDIPPSGNAGHFASIAIGSDGNPVISHRDQGATALRVVKCATPGCVEVYADGFE